jgi:capsular exopolysaccharide synthesis family protein
MSDNSQTPLSQEAKENESLSLRGDLVRYLKYWKWIVFSVVIALALSFLYLRYTPKIYFTNAKIKILKKKESGMDMTGLSNVAPLFDMSSINLSNEIEILNSRRIIGEVVDNLNLTTYFYKTGNIKDKELFGNQCPIKVDWLINLKNADNFKELDYNYIYQPIDAESFNIKIKDNDSFDKNFSYGEEIKIDDLSFVIYKNLSYEEDKDSYDENESVIFTYKSRRSRIGYILSKLETEQVGDDSEVLELNLVGENYTKNEAILNNLVEVFNKDGINDDKEVAEKTVKFVTNRLATLERELDTVENNLVDFRKSNNFISEATGTTSLFGTYTQAEQEKANLENQLEVSKLIQNEITNSNTFDLLPGISLGLDNANTNSLITKYNELVQQRSRLLVSSTETNPTVIKISQELRLLKSNLNESINNYIRSLQVSLQNMSRREYRFNSDIKDIPENEKIAREIKRQQEVKENLYIFLLQKQVEADISAAITAPTAKIVDYAFTNSAPVSPKPLFVYLRGLVIGILIPLGVLYIMYLFDTKITSKEQVQSKLNIPIIAEIPLSKEYDNVVIDATDNSNVAEAFRILKTNMNYLITEEKDNKSSCKVIFSTSSTKGEGKTFTAINVASVFSSNNQKSLLIGCDLRNPQLHSYLNVSKKNIGLSSYLVDSELKLNDVIFKGEKDLNFDIILSGEIPPNPSELLNNGRLEELIEEAKQIYDYVVIDTAPTMLVTDTLTIINLADAVIYMVRANYTELKVLRHIKELTKFNMNKNVGIAINAVDEKKGYEYNYGYGYGYGVDTNAKKWYQF